MQLSIEEVQGKTRLAKRLRLCIGGRMEKLKVWRYTALQKNNGSIRPQVSREEEIVSSLQI